MKIWCALLLFSFPYFLFSHNHFGGCSFVMVNHVGTCANPFGSMPAPSREMAIVQVFNFYDQFLTRRDHAL